MLELRLFGQIFGAVDVEVLRQRLRGGIWLAAADGEGIVARLDDGFAGCSDHTEVAILQLEVDLLRCPCGEMNALESAECPKRRARNVRELEIELDNLIAFAAAAVGDGDVGRDRIARSYSLRWER